MLEGLELAMHSTAAKHRSTNSSEAGVIKSLFRREILLVEDMPIDRRLLATLLQRAGASVTLECNGQAAVEEVFPRFGGPRKFDAIVMDLMMTPVDGAEATAQLRRRGFTAPIIITTASEDPVDEERCRTAGCSRFLRKPIGHKQLIHAISSCIAPLAGSDGLSIAAG